MPNDAKTHTPGPWKAIGKGDMSDGGSSKLHPHFNGRIVGPKGAEIIIQSCFLGVLGKTKEEAEANARLIAAAPELLVAAETARLAFLAIADSAGDSPFWNEGGTGYQAAHQLRAAIAKAEGRA